MHDARDVRVGIEKEFEGVRIEITAFEVPALATFAPGYRLCNAPSSFPFSLPWSSDCSVGASLMPTLFSSHPTAPPAPSLGCIPTNTLRCVVEPAPAVAKLRDVHRRLLGGEKRQLQEVTKPAVGSQRLKGTPGCCCWDVGRTGCLCLGAVGAAMLGAVGSVSRYFEGNTRLFRGGRLHTIGTTSRRAGAWASDLCRVQSLY